MSDTQIIKKRAVSGSIRPRWPKTKVVKWLEIGAIPAIVGLWWPDWIGSFAAEGTAAIPPSLPPHPPVVAYAGAVILLIACYQGIKDMGYHFKGVIVSGALCLAAAAASVVAVLLGANVVTLLFTGFAAVFASAFFWFTIGKVAEITQETRTRVTWWLVLGLTLSTAAVYLWGVYLYAIGAGSAIPALRAGVVLLTLTFGACRYGVHCYKTQTSIGAGFRDDPDNQYWATA